MLFPLDFLFLTRRQLERKFLILPGLLALVIWRYQPLDREFVSCFGKVDGPKQEVISIALAVLFLL